MEINLGTIKMPLNAATKTFAILAKRGAGKSYTAAVLAEEFFKVGVPFVVFDPIDVWWGLRLAANGKDKGLPIVVFGVENADIQLTRDMGRDIARAIVKENVSCVISTYGMPKVAQRHLIAEFAEELLNINRTPRHVFIEEAHEFVPQRVMGAMGRTFAAVEALVVMGRNKGIGVTLINQRAATVNKDVLTQLDTLLAFRNVAPQDRKALKEWVEAHSADGDFEEFMKSLPSLPTGEGWIWSPEFLGLFKRIKIRKRETFHPDREKLGTAFQMPHIDQADVQSFIQNFKIEPPTKEGKEERRRKEVPAVAPSPIPDDSIRVLRNEYESKLMEKDTEINRLNGIVRAVQRAVGSSENNSLPFIPGGDKNNSLIDSLPSYEKDIIAAIRKHPNIPFTRAQLAIKSGKSDHSSTYAAAVHKLIKLKLIQRSGTDLTYVP
jgi:hypothetical protein